MTVSMLFLLPLAAALPIPFVLLYEAIRNGVFSCKPAHY